MPLYEETGKFETLIDIIATLRGEHGCPWDKKQTRQSLKTYLVEECYEALEAIERDNAQEICAELGDVLLQIMLHAQIASEKGEFTIDDVVRGISTKLIRRHPHVFAQQRSLDVDEVEMSWEELKKEERGECGFLLENIPRHMPALTHSQSIQRRVASVGFDWEDSEDIWPKLSEEIGEFKKATDRKERIAEIGDIFFTLVNIARRMGIDSEMALREANERFSHRFGYMEQRCRERGTDIAELSLQEQDTLWEEAKEEEKE